MTDAKRLPWRLEIREGHPPTKHSGNRVSLHVLRALRSHQEYQGLQGYPNTGRSEKGMEESLLSARSI